MREARRVQSTISKRYSSITGLVSTSLEMRSSCDCASSRLQPSRFRTKNFPWRTSLSGLGYEQVRDVRQGKFFVLNLDGWSRDEAQSQLERISKEVLTNPVIEEYRFEIVD